ncbi:MAG: phospho-N-acetylmuramoyl-pentapeptide-transferase [bacterium]
MFYWLFYEHLFAEGSIFSFLRVFRYITFRAAYAAIFSLIICFILAPWIIKWLKAKGFCEKVRAEYLEGHLHKEGTPTMGGIIILASLLLSVLLWARATPPLVVIVLATTAFGILGFIDDIIKQKKGKGLAIRHKLFGEILIGTAVGLYLCLCPLTANNTVVVLPFIKGASFDLGLFYIPFAILVIVAASNAVNLTDGLDGLAIGSCIFVVIGLILLAYVAGHYKLSSYLKVDFIKGGGEIVVFLSALVGASLGFLWYNSHPAQVFLGDTGSLSLGGAIGTVALVIKQEIPLVIIGGLFVIEAGSCLIQILSFKLFGKRVFAMAPLHHHFEKKGWPESKIVIRFWIIAIIFVLLSLSTLKLR